MMLWSWKSLHSLTLSPQGIIRLFFALYFAAQQQEVGPLTHLFHHPESESSEDDQLVSLAMIVPQTEAEGPGRRWAVWFQGCPFRCPGCCNPEYLSFRGGTRVSLESLQASIAEVRSQIEGITLLGGEPFAHARAGRALAEYAQALGLSVMTFTGYTLEEILLRADENEQALLRATDLLVDGRYEQSLPDHERRGIGSTNQRIHFLTPRYSATDRYWQERNTLEIRVTDNEIMINGFPAGQAKSLWQNIKPRRRALERGRDE